MMLAGDAHKQHPRLDGISQRLRRAPLPVNPGRLVALLRRHFFRRRFDFAPVALAQRGAQAPGELFFGQRRIAGLGIPVERFGQIAPRRVQRQLAQR